MKNIHKVSATIAVLGFLVVASAAYAQTATTTKDFFGHFGHGSSNGPIVGTVSVVNGSILTVTVQASSTAAITTYSVNDSGAKVIRSGTTTTASSIQINDKIVVFGTLSGTNITAKVIIDGVLPQTTGPPAWTKGGHAGSKTGRSFASSTRAFNKSFVKPAAFGSVSEITSDSSFDIAERTKTGTTTYMINTDSSTVFEEGTTTATFSNLAVGNLVAVTGTTTGTDQILASKVMIMPKMSWTNKANGFGVRGNGRFKRFHKFASSTPQ